MSLAIGKQLGSYTILSAIGKGGMGEVYRARDTRLDRDVAIKTLPGEFETDADRLARFEREAKVLASLNHPNIGAIYGIEKHDDRHFLVLELVEGETLADQIARGPIPVDDSLKLAQQIAEALQAAHEKGVIHRDLKPANIKITPDGTVKVLDFGLAKAGDVESSGADVLSNSPTLRTLASSPGMILGTAAYMSPEQAKGKTVDRRTDIFAFGCVLYEMLTGKRERRKFKRGRFRSWTANSVTLDVLCQLARGHTAARDGFKPRFPGGRGIQSSILAWRDTHIPQRLTLSFRTSRIRSR
jgi:serine/threonine protein kinase